ncbi:MAG: hypothetical protein PHT80_15830 [Lentisphaeria bacterium]|nr:hypothetical protein [Lentisphaeria bacterium]
MKCDDVELEVVSSAGELSAAVREHLGQCAACERFARMQALALGEPGDAAQPSVALDRRVLAAVHERMAGQRRWQRLLRVGGGMLVPLAVAALLLLGLWLRLPPETPSPVGVTVADGGEQIIAAPAVAPAAGEVLPVASDDDLWLLGVAMTDVEMDDLEEGIARLIAGVRESSEAPAKSSPRLDPGMTESRLEDFREKLMALEFELLGDM